MKLRGYDKYATVSEPVQDREGAVDIAICFSVIAHVQSLNDFLSDVRRFLKPRGKLAPGFDNANDLLLSLLLKNYP